MTKAASPSPKQGSVRIRRPTASISIIAPPNHRTEINGAAPRTVAGSSPVAMAAAAVVFRSVRLFIWSSKI